MSRFTRGLAAFGAAVLLLSTTKAEAHGFAGERFFPATLQTDDPFVADEMSLPTLARTPTTPRAASPIPSRSISPSG